MSIRPFYSHISICVCVCVFFEHCHLIAIDVDTNEHYNWQKCRAVRKFMVPNSVVMPCRWNATYESLLGTNKPFPQRIRLPVSDLCSYSDIIFMF